jgi:hypothetical protein
MVRSASNRFSTGGKKEGPPASCSCNAGGVLIFRARVEKVSRRPGYFPAWKSAPQTRHRVRRNLGIQSTRSPRITAELHRLQRPANRAAFHIPRWNIAAVTGRTPG